MAARRTTIDQMSRIAQRVSGKRMRYRMSDATWAMADSSASAPANGAYPPTPPNIPAMPRMMNDIPLNKPAACTALSLTVSSTN